MDDSTGNPLCFGVDVDLVSKVGKIGIGNVKSLFGYGGVAVVFGFAFLLQAFIIYGDRIGKVKFFTGSSTILSTPLSRRGLSVRWIHCFVWRFSR